MIDRHYFSKSTFAEMNLSAIVWHKRVFGAIDDEDGYFLLWDGCKGDGDASADRSGGCNTVAELNGKALGHHGTV